MNSLPLFDALGVNIPKQERKNPRMNLPVDMIYTLNNADCTCCLAVQAGLKYGIQSKSFKVCPYESELSGRHKITFIDNNYFNYDHMRHIATINQFKPKYATVRDIMDKEQCRKANIEWFSIEQILDWAEEVSEYAKKVIVIPKYNCLDKIPSNYILGFSIPTSHGGTEMLPETFDNRPVHLLGGSWKQQLHYLKKLNVISMDNNYIQHIARRFGKYVMPDGEVKSFSDMPYLTNVRYAALALSFGAIGYKINQLNKEK